MPLGEARPVFYLGNLSAVNFYTATQVLSLTFECMFGLFDRAHQQISKSPKLTDCAVYAKPNSFPS